jgi:uncharacterized protein YgiM (DUF1202 family)
MRSKRRALLRTLLVAAIAMFAGASMAYAETVKARRTANVYTERGERSKVTTTVRSGKSLKVIGRKGRWLKVKVNGRVGWIVRSNVAASQARKTKERTKRRRAFVNGRSRKRDLRRRSAPKDRYGLDATGSKVDDDDYVIVDDGETARSKKSKKPKKAKSSKKPKKAKKVKKVKKAKKAAKSDDEEDGDLDDWDEDDLDDDPLVADEEDIGDDDDDEEDSGPEFVVAAVDVDLRAEQDKLSEEVSFASPGEKLAVVERDGDWIKVKTTDGDVGWVPSSKIEGEGGGGGTGEYTFLVRASLGYGSMSQSFTSNDTAQLFGNYDIGASSAVIGVGGEIWYDYSEDYMLGGELDLGYTISTPGIRVQEGDNAADTGFSIIEVGAYGKAGYKLHPGTGAVVFARLGFRYHSFQIKNVNDIDNTNLAALPSENLTSPVVGAELAVPMLTDKISARLVLDTMLIGSSRSQTAGLEDGQVSRAKAFSGGAFVTYDYKPNLTLLGGLDYEWAKTTWTGDAMSQRKHDATTAERSDSTYILSLGLSKGF